jgi:hypothetical protein
VATSLFIGATSIYKERDCICKQGWQHLWAAAGIVVPVTHHRSYHKGLRVCAHARARTRAPAYALALAWFGGGGEGGVGESVELLRLYSLSTILEVCSSASGVRERKLDLLGLALYTIRSESYTCIYHILIAARCFLFSCRNSQGRCTRYCHPPLSTYTTFLTHYLGAAGPAAVGHVRVDIELRGLHSLSTILEVCSSASGVGERKLDLLGLALYTIRSESYTCVYHVLIAARCFLFS